MDLDRIERRMHFWMAMAITSAFVLAFAREVFAATPNVLDMYMYLAWAMVGAAAAEINL